MAIALASCVNKQFYESYAAKVDSLQATLEASATSFEQLDTLAIRQQFINIRNILDTLEKLPLDSVVSPVRNYEYIRKSYKTILREYPLAIEELSYSREQLEALKHDIEHKHLDEELIKSYFRHEEEAVSLLKEKMKILGDIAQKQSDSYATKLPDIEHLIDSLSHQN